MTSAQSAALSSRLPAARKESTALRSADFRHIYQTGVRVNSRYFAAFCLHDDRPAARFGFTIPRALGKAVARNRMRRRMRAAVMSEGGAELPGWAIVFNPRRSVLDADFRDLRREVGRVFQKCRES